MSVTGLLAAQQVAARAGIDPQQLLREGVDTVLGWLGIGQCSSTNKAKYRALAAAASTDDLVAKLEGRKPLEGTGNCRKAHQLYVAAELLRRLDTQPQRNARQATSFDADWFRRTQDPTWRPVDYDPRDVQALDQVNTRDQFATYQSAAYVSSAELGRLRQANARQQQKAKSSSGGGAGPVIAGLIVTGVLGVAATRKGKRR